MKRGVFALAVVAAFVLAVGVPVTQAASQRSLRVAIIVGPVGDLTESYRTQADAAAQEARRWASDVVTVYSPDATWPAVRRALQGASIVVYLGHGNGWPSRYRDALYPTTQDGMGLNPVAGVDDTAHQYFGEAYLARSVRLAPGAIVILSHLCYASGNSEPGLPEGTLDMARQRVENFAAGWIAAGASAVVAEAHSSPIYYVHGLLSARRSVEQVWRASPTFNDHVLTFSSRRSAGATALMDPDRPTSGFYRSLVVVGRSASSTGPGGSSSNSGPSVPAAPPVPTLAGLGVRIGDPSLDGLPIAGSSHELSLPVTSPAAVHLPTGIGLGIRWEAIQLDVVHPDDAAAPDAGAEPSPSPSTGPSPSPSDATPSADPGSSTVSPAPVTRTTVPDPPEIQLVTAEATSDVVAVAKTSRSKDGLLAAVTMPSIPGLYRVSLSLHDPDGVAYDAATQALLPALSVRVTGSVSAVYSVAPDLTAEAGHPFTVPVRVANTGDTDWGFGAGPSPDTPSTLVSDSVAVPWVMGHWVRLAGPDQAAPTPSRGVPVLVQPGESSLAPLELVAPTDLGAYLLVIDTVTPAQGSLAALGVAPALVRVTVVTPAPEASTRPK
jgi:hypothetical protein